MKPSYNEMSRRLGTADAVIIGLGAMIGAGIFSAVAPAAESAGSLLLLGLLIAAAVAYANATSSAQLASLYPESGGTHVYARNRLGDYWGFLAGWGFVVGKVASLSAMALTFGTYVYRPLARPLGIAAVIALTIVNYRGVEKTARLTRVIVAVVLGTLAAVVLSVLVGGGTSVGNLGETTGIDALGVLRASGLLFFAFAGYARIATLGEEVRDPEVTIPRAIPIALLIVVAVYAVVMATALLAVGPVTLAQSPAPLATAVEAGRWPRLAPIVRVGAAIASAGVLLSLLAGVSRTCLSIARRRELPRFLEAIHPDFRTPHRAEVVVATLVSVIVLLTDLRGSIGFSSFAVLIYAITNASAWGLKRQQRRWPRWLSGAGFIGCVVLAFTLPPSAVIGGVGVLASGSIGWLIARNRSSPTEA